ncbi:hypothetical protein AAF302_000693 [Pluralibacter gergoviae]
MLDSIKEFASSTFNTALNRVKNPAFGAFSLSWCAFNWKSILYLFLSDGKALDKINYISSNSSWKTAILYPCISLVVICAILPWVNNIISRWQAKPLDNNDSIENHRKAKLILRATRLQRLQAKHDVTYEKVKTGAEKDIQKMKEEIISSKDRVGALTSELKKKEEELYIAQGEIINANSLIKEMKTTIDRQNKNYSILEREFNDYKDMLLDNENVTMGNSGDSSVKRTLAHWLRDTTPTELESLSKKYGVATDSFKTIVNKESKNK